MNEIIINDINEIVHNKQVDWKQLFGCTVLVTGATGILGSYVVFVLMLLNSKYASDIKIIAVSRSKERADKLLSKYNDSDNLVCVFQDVCNPIDLSGKIDYIFHAASNASPKFYNIDPVGIIDANVIGTRNILNLAKEKNVKSMIFFSSGEVYGSSEQDKLLTETNYGYIDINNIRNCYSESKRLGEIMSVSWSHQYNVPVKIARLFHTYGPSMVLDDGRVFADFIKNIVLGNNITIKSSGESLRAFCYINDAIIGLFLLLLKGENKEAYNIGNPDQEITIKNLALKLINLVPDKKLDVVFEKHENINYLASPLNRNCPDIFKLSQLGWSPSITLDDGFLRVIKSFDYEY